MHFLAPWQLEFLLSIACLGYFPAHRHVWDQQCDPIGARGLPLCHMGKGTRLALVTQPCGVVLTDG